LDPITIIATANAAFGLLKKGIAAGKDIEDMGSTLAKWGGAIADFEFVERRVSNPPWYKSFGGTVQAEAIEIYAARKRIDQQRQELRTYLGFAYGPNAWNDLMRIEGQIRKQRAAREHRKQERKDWAITILIIIIAGMAGTAGLAILAFAFLHMEQGR
jgi:hypothetical protein